MKIRAALARAGEPFALEDVELDGPRAREALVRVEACGVCRTDLSARDGHLALPLPAVLGHEGVGRVLAVGDGVDHVAVGDRVVMSFGACGTCPECEDAAPAYCRRARAFTLEGRRLDGSSPIACDGRPITGHFLGQSSFASHAVAAATNLVKIDDDLAPATVAALACSAQTGAGAIVLSLEAGPRDVALVLGCGAVGLAAVMAAAIVGCRTIVAVDLLPARRALARELGATDVVDGAAPDLAAALRAHGPTAALDTTGRPDVVAAALAALRPRGRLALAALAAPGAALALDMNRLMLSGRSVRGTVEGDADPRTFIPRMLAWHRAGRLPLERLVTTYPFDQINQAAADMHAGRVVKPVLLMS